jgi:hypothetical protein
MDDAYKVEVAYKIVKILAESPLSLAEAKEVLEFSKNLADEFDFDFECQVIKEESLMYPTGTKFKTKDGKKWEIIALKYADNNKIFLSYYCICRDKPIHEFKDFTESKMKGVELI